MYNGDNINEVIEILGNLVKMQKVLIAGGTDMCNCLLRMRENITEGVNRYY